MTQTRVSFYTKHKILISKKLFTYWRELFITFSRHAWRVSASSPSTEGQDRFFREMSVIYWQKQHSPGKTAQRASEREANKTIHGESRRRQMNEAPRKLGFIH